MATQTNSRVRFQFRRDTASAWAANNPILFPGEIGIETDTGSLKFGDGVSTWNALDYFAPESSGGGGGSSVSYSQKTKLNCSANETFSITVPQTTNFCRPPMEVLKFVSASAGIVLTACSFSNGDASDFQFDSDSVVFDGLMHPKNSFGITMTTPTAFSGGYLSQSSNTVDFNSYGSVSAFTAPAYGATSPAVGIALMSTGGGNGTWRQLETKGEVTRASLYVVGNYAYGVTDNGFEQVTSNWNSLTNTEKAALFQKVTGEPTLANLQTIGIFSIYCYATDSSSYAYAITGTPSGKQLVKPRGLINLSQYENINSANMVYAVGSNSGIKLAVTPDGTNYFTYDFTNEVWVKLNTVTADSVYADGIPVNQLSNIPASDLTELMKSTSNEGIGFAYSLYQANTAESCYTDELTLNVDAKGTWVAAVNGTDYTYAYTGNTTVTVTALTAGDYKVNYAS